MDLPSENTQKLPHVVVVGAGFGGLRAARALAKAPVHVTIVDKNNYHLFQPFLYLVATAGLSATDIAHPVRKILQGQQNASFTLAEVQEVDFENKRLHTPNGEVPYDYLVLAVGGTTNYFGNQSVAQNGFGLKDLDEATAIRNHILKMFELANQETDPEVRRAMLTFVIVGGGPTGVECAGAISELNRLVLTKDYRHLDFNDVRVILLEAADRLLAHLPAGLSENTAAVLQQKHVEVQFGATVQGYDGKQVTFQDGKTLPACTLIWAAGVNANPLVSTLGADLGRQRRVKVLPTLQLPNHPEVFVIGDAAYLEDGQGHPLPMVAPVAMQQAETAAGNIRRILRGEALNSFVYKDPGSLATIGRNQAVASISGIQFKGFLAWAVWLVVHIMQLIGFRNRLVVLINWAWDYIFYDRFNRLITPE
ncbi:MAG: NAD(P)/FAD-dependent oxidoreductase [Chloroflexi bacterium]|nr:NAD(P)/FAD-dependent oxidoreductase [Chloroflexota bacterium]